MSSKLGEHFRIFALYSSTEEVEVMVMIRLPAHLYS